MKESLHSTSIYTNLKQEVKDDKFLEECWAPGVLLCFVGARLAIGYLINYDNLTSTTIIASALYAVTLNFRFLKLDYNRTYLYICLTNRKF